MEKPTAVQFEADVHETAFKNELSAPVGSGTDWRLQLVPFQRSANAWLFPEVSSAVPTAVHADEDVHETP
jgi:hypothetical protein